MAISVAREILLSLAAGDCRYIPSLVEQGSTAGKICLSEHAQADGFMRLIAMRKRLQINLSRTQKSNSLVVRAINSQVEVILQDHDELISKLEHKIIVQDPSLVNKLGQVSLISLWTSLSHLEQSIGHLNRVTDVACAMDEERANTNISDLCAFLSDQTITGYEALRPVADNFLQVAHRVLLQQIESWVIYGDLRSVHPKDFFIHEDRQHENAYKLDMDFCPALVETRTAATIYRLGLIRRSLHAHKPLYSKGSVETSFLKEHRELLSTIQLPCDSRVLRERIDALERSFSANVLVFAMPMRDLIGFLRFLDDHFLLRNGQFSLSLIETAQRDFRSMRSRDPGQLRNSTVQAILRKALSKVASLDYTDDELEETSQRSLSMRLADAETTHKTSFEDLLFGVHVKMAISIEWPLNVFVGQEELDHYSVLFSYLIALRRVEHLLQDLWRGRRSENKQPTISRTVWLTAFRALFFLESLSEFYHSNGISKFRKNISNMYPTDDEQYIPSVLAQRHRVELTGLLKAVLPQNEDLRQTLRKLLLEIELMLSSLRRGYHDRLVKHCIEVVDLIETATNLFEFEIGTEPLLFKLHANDR